jgi:membrane protein
MKKIIFKAPRIKFASSLLSSLGKAANYPRKSYAAQRYNAPLFIMHETLRAFQRHNVLGLSASLSFYAMFALIPLVLLMFFLLSQLVFSSDYAIVKLAIITGNLVPRLSSTIMTEIYNSAQHKAAWGAIGLFVLLWAVTPLAGAMRSTFYNIATLTEAPSYLRRKLKDMIAILGMLMMFFLFTVSSLLLDKFIAFFGTDHQLLQSVITPLALVSGFISLLFTLTLTTLVIAIFYFTFFPVRLNNKHIIIGALFTAALWLLMRPAFTLFLSVNESYGAIFGSLKNLFISITWLYFNFTAFLLGTELIATLRKKDVLLLKKLFNDMPQLKPTFQFSYLKILMKHFGKFYRHGDYVFHYGDTTHQLYFLVAGEVKMLKENKVLRTVKVGEYFGEIALLSNLPTFADAIISSRQAEIIHISAENIETLLLDEPKVAMSFIRNLATKLQIRN